ncbi:MAG: ribonuclease P protein subunit [Thermoplasmata archaeon]|nr:ribonuclease P protein subunit [Thermoplasmata archaeon]
MRKRDALMLYGGEVIGLKIKVTDSPDPTLIGREGWIVDESEKTLIMNVGERGEITVPKKGLRFTVEDFGDSHPSAAIISKLGRVEMDGNMLLHRHHSRLKKVDKIIYSKKGRKEV